MGIKAKGLARKIIIARVYIVPYKPASASLLWQACNCKLQLLTVLFVELWLRPRGRRDKVRVAMSLTELCNPHEMCPAAVEQRKQFVGGFDRTNPDVGMRVSINHLVEKFELLSEKIELMTLIHRHGT